LTGGPFWFENCSVAESSAAAGVPGRSPEQRLRALEQANAVRIARAELKKQLALGKLELVQILADPPPCVRTARLRDLLLVLPKIGSVRAARILAHCGIAHSKTLAGLSERQRGELINFFQAHPDAFAGARRRRSATSATSATEKGRTRRPRAAIVPLRDEPLG